MPILQDGPQGSGEEAVHVFSCCARVLIHVRCLAAPTSSRSPEVSCPTCPASLSDSVSLDWFTRLCHINGVQLLEQDDLGECMLCREELDVESSIRAPCCSHSLHGTCLARSFKTRGQSCPFCNQSLSDLARPASFQASSLFHGCMIDFDASPTNRGINSLSLRPDFLVLRITQRSCVASVSVLPHSSNLQVIVAWNWMCVPCNRVVGLADP